MPLQWPAKAALGEERRRSWAPSHGRSLPDREARRPDATGPAKVLVVPNSDGYMTVEEFRAAFERRDWELRISWMSSAAGEYEIAGRVEDDGAFITTWGQRFRFEPNRVPPKGMVLGILELATLATLAIRDQARTAGVL